MAVDFDVVCIGNAIVDVLAHADESFLDTHGMVKGAMQLVDSDTAHRLYESMGPAVESSGGSAANTAAGIASFGGRAAFIGKVGHDVLGEVFTHDIRASGVEYRPSGTSTEHATARCLVFVTPDAQRTMNTFLGVSSLISPRDVDADLVAAAQVVYCEGYLWDLPAAKEAIRKGMDIARDSGRKVAFTLSDPFCVDRHRADFLDLAEHRIDILFANEAEICSLYRTDSWTEAARHVEGHCEIACLTRSEHGSVVVTADGGRIEVPAVPVDNVADTTGAGDLYAAGFLFGLTNGHELGVCGRLAALAAGEIIGHMGARPECSLVELAKGEGIL